MEPLNVDFAEQRVQNHLSSPRPVDRYIERREHDKKTPTGDASSIVHFGLYCDGPLCKEKANLARPVAIRGVLSQCLYCGVDFHLCSNCRARHNPLHPIKVSKVELQLKYNDIISRAIGRPYSQHSAECLLNAAGFTTGVNAYSLHPIKPWAYAISPSIPSYFREGLRDIAELLLDNGARVDARGDDRRTLLHQAATIGDISLTDFLIGRGAPLNAKTMADGITPLMCAALGGNAAIVQLLVRAGADMLAVNTRKQNVLHVVLSNGDGVGNGAADVLPLLLERAPNLAKLDSQGDTALRTAVRFNRIEAITHFSDAGCNMNGGIDHPKFNGQFGEAPMSLAMRQNKPDMVAVLAKAGYSTTGGASYMILAAARLKAGCIIARLLAIDGDFEKDDARNPHQSSDQRIDRARPSRKFPKNVLPSIGTLGSDEAEKLAAFKAALPRPMLSRDFDVNKTDPNDPTAYAPLHLLAYMGKAEVHACFQALLSAGANMEQRDAGGMTPLLVSSLVGNTSYFLLLKQNGADVKAVNNSGENALKLAVMHKHRDIGKILGVGKVLGDTRRVCKTGL